MARAAGQRAVPRDVYEQLKQAIEAVFSSWNNKRAIDYRNFNKIPHDLGTAVNVQTMVFGNMGERAAPAWPLPVTPVPARKCCMAHIW